MADKKATEDYDFAKAAERLEAIVAELQSSALGVDDALRLYEEGMALVRDTEAYLTHAEHVVSKLKVSL